MKRTVMKASTKTLGIFLIAVVMITGMVAPRPTCAAPPAPKWMPGMPMVAGNQLILMWAVVPGAAKYKVYQDGKVVFEGPAIQAIVPVPSQPGEYKFHITAVGADGSESGPSDVKTQAVIKMDPPKNVVARPEADRITLRWDTSANAVIYDIYKKSSGDADFKLLASVQETRYTDLEAKVGETYQYTLRAKDATGKQSDLSAPAEATIQAAAATGAASKAYERHALPARLIKTFEFGLEPQFLDIRGDRAVLTSGNSIWIADKLPNGQFVSMKVEGVTSARGFQGVVFDSDGTILVSGLDRVYRLDQLDAENLRVIAEYPVPAPGKDPNVEEDLVFLNRKKEVSKYDKIPEIYDVKVASNGDIVGTDNANQRLVRLTSDGEYLGTVGYLPEQSEQPVELPDWRYPVANFLSIDSSDLIYVTQFFSIQVSGPDGKRLGSMGGLGNTVGTFGMSSGTVLDEENRIWIADIKNASIQVFGRDDKGGEYEYKPLYLLSNEDKKGAAEVLKPTDVAWGPLPGGKVGLYVVDTIMRRIGVFDILWDKAE